MSKRTVAEQRVERGQNKRRTWNALRPQLESLQTMADAAILIASQPGADHGQKLLF